MRKRRVLILDGSLWTDAYRPTADWAGCMPGVEVLGCNLPAGEVPPDPAGFTHLVVTGSEASILTPAPWFQVQAEVIAAAHRLGLPILASCFGHQMLARTFSGAQYVGPAPTPEVGWIELELLADDPLLEGVERRPWCFASHFDQVPAPPPPPWRVLARSALCPVQVMRLGSHPVWGIQAHPEIGPAAAARLLATARERMPDQAELFARAQAQPVRDSAFAGRLVANFLAAGEG